MAVPELTQLFDNLREQGYIEPFTPLGTNLSSLRVDFKTVVSRDIFANRFIAANSSNTNYKVSILRKKLNAMGFHEMKRVSNSGNSSYIIFDLSPWNEVITIERYGELLMEFKLIIGVERDLFLDTIRTEAWANEFSNDLPRNYWQL
ncbi:hypothetical protein FE394_08730 [Xenorhabdus sp. Reich]|uniref:Uncharacterized protein n=1 Tax=Xenorhabdus littoralis TaxID=2582835 RepID=A0ABU4SL68_9GAMM|nr:hypothetical protein [Xenorhabdus sp. Reich]MDX7999285.1 hypothetical protein [Xenorhabdus sp. Reich]